MAEKLTLPTSNLADGLQRPLTAQKRSKLRFWAIAGIVGVALYHGTTWAFGTRGLLSWSGCKHHHKDMGCPYQPEPLHPKLLWNVTEEERDQAVDRFAQAVRIPTQSYDDNGEPTDDPRWAPFRVFQDWLKESYPLAWSTANVEFINELGILATFTGSDRSLKPLILMSHYDVVPAPNSTADRWTHPPFSGYNDGTYIWGRGAADDKALLVSQWEAISHLLASGFQPRRTLILSHGFDEEEVFARRGQGTIAPFLEKRYGKDGILMVIDEGSGTSDDFYGAPFALPNMGEKGYMDIKIAVHTTGGHSSVPPSHTGIGIMSDVVIALEDNPFDIKLTSDSPYLTTLQCASEHSPSFPRSLSRLLKLEGPRNWPRLAKKLSRESNFERAMLGTTTAVDVINGGVKVNALPEVVTSLVNFRIDFDESIASAQHHVEKLLRKVAKKHDLDFSGFETSGNATGTGIRVQLLGAPLEPAPRTPSSGPVWELFAGTVKSAIPGPDGKERIVAPYVSTGNTDCKMYYNLSKNIYRFAAGPSEGSSGVHTVDERSSIQGFFQIVRWIHAIIQNTDAYTGAE